MFVYLSKKIAIPQNLQLEVVAWNTAQGWLVCGGEKGLVKVLKLESAADARGAGAGGQNLSMNQTLEGHQGTVMCATWNENFRKLTTSDQNGLIIVWMLHRGIWFEEMINNRNRSVVRDMKWTQDGQKICIIYEDGAVIVGTVDGQRLWGKELKGMQLHLVEWSPDGKQILFCTVNEVHVYDQEGVFSHRVPMLCLDEGSEGSARLAGLHWFDQPTATTPSLVIGFEHGRVQLLRGQSGMDDNPVLIDTQMRITGLNWDPSGNTVAIAGMEEGPAPCCVQFYAPSGQHLRTLRVPGQALRSLSWEGDGLRLSLAVDAHIFFANVRPDYPWAPCSEGRTLVYAGRKSGKEREEHAVYFWDIHSDEKYTKYIKNVVSIKSADAYRVIAAKQPEEPGWILIVCNAIGSPLESRTITFEPLHVAMTAQHVIAASEDTVYAWNYRAALREPTPGGEGIRAINRQRATEHMFQIDVSLVGGACPDKDSFVPSATPTQDPIASIAATSSCLILARESGVVQRYALPHLMLERKFVVKCRPQVVALNCDATRLSVIDISGVLTLHDVSGTEALQLELERKDVWNMKWAEDNPEQLAIMEKTRMYVLRGTELEEPVLSSAYAGRRGWRGRRLFPEPKRLIALRA
jgi:WD repeat-containing protein 35